ncbi:Peptidase C54 family protein [Babesia bovis T2Bo]|uniref:Peptidase C54 family protein n=1 Tax=Babesia bovis T2Bo TaxID=484906 RepID=UPI001C3650C0|nr:Peptidase C54 family protein [Babesia bovis T2Bo]EDO06505.2 Peptidase C54 family protein [Babesia bovis T2Bo]
MGVDMDQTAVVLGHTFAMCDQNPGPKLRERLKDFILLTYRRGLSIHLPRFYAGNIPKRFYGIWPLWQQTDIKTDRGWGCALRATQMALAEALRDVLSPLDNVQEQRSRILQLFYDTTEAPFSLENLVMADVEHGACIKPLQFGCASSAFLISHLINTQKTLNIASIAFTDGIVDIKKIERATSEQRNVVAWITVQKELSESQNECLKYLFTLPWFKGMVGAKKDKQRAYYFVGHHGNQALYLDPHEYCPDRLDNTSDPIYNYVKKLNRLPWDTLNQSKTMCLLIQNNAELRNFLRALSRFPLRALPFEMANAIY